MSFRRYSNYKDSGVEWLGSVPEHWGVDRLKWSTLGVRNGIWGDEPQGNGDDITCIRVADFDRQVLRVVLDEPTVRNVTAKERVDRIVHDGDLLLEKSGGGELQPVGCVVVYDGSQPAVCSNFIARVKLAPEMNPSFWRYVHAATYAVRLNTRSIKQTSGIQNLDQQQYLDERVAFPPREEQAAIAAFLDRETFKIDALVAQQRQLVELLNEKRQAAISHAVTKGLNPDVPLKDSGIEWLGDVPAHWEIARLKHFVRTIEQGWSPQCESFSVDGDSAWGVLKVGCVNGGVFEPSENKAFPSDQNPLPELTISRGDLLVSRANTRELVGSAAVAQRNYARLMLSDKLYRLRFHTGIHPEFVAAYLGSVPVRGQLELQATGASDSMLNISQAAIMDLAIAAPPADEQAAIIRSILAESDRLTCLNKAAQDAIDLLLERRSALISAAVTGQIDVRNLSSEKPAA